MKTIVLTFLVLSVIIASVLGDRGECSPGETKKLDCNNCHCANGVWACERKFCIKREKRQRGSYCQPGSSFKKDCNSCICNPQGTNAACTQRACL